MLFYGAPGFDYISGYQDPYLGVSSFEQNECVSESLRGIHMLIVLLEEKVLQNEQEIAHLQRIIWKLQQENDCFRERIQRLETTVAELWQNNSNSGSHDSGAYSEISSELYEDRDPNEIVDIHNGMYPHPSWETVSSEHTTPGFDAHAQQMYWPSQPVLCYFYGAPTVSSAYVNNESVSFDGQENDNFSLYYCSNTYNM